ncbi:hypothetical protein KEJ34_04295 [Candidatus Bathyarchaeota archaeon]|nr:hypothetical protein [Candidatus Bathyarchaeota archaeon]
MDSTRSPRRQNRIERLIKGFIEAGFDIPNPVQTSAANMDPQRFKSKYGEKITFWAAWILSEPYRLVPPTRLNPTRLKKEVCERIQIFAPGGGFVFNTVHNVQPKIPIKNILVIYEAFQEYGAYPIQR